MTINYNIAIQRIFSSTKNVNQSIASLLIGTLLSATVAFLVVKGFGDQMEWSLMYSAILGFIIGTSTYWLILNLNSAFHYLTEKNSINVVPIPDTTVTYLFDQKNS